MNKNSDSLSSEKIKELASRKIAENEKNRDKSKSVHSEQLNFSVKIAELIASAPSDLPSASRLLQIAAEQLGLNAPLHPMMAAYLADAFRATVAQPFNLQARELTDKLHLTSQKRRPAQNWFPAGKAFADHLTDGMSKNKAKAAISADFGIDETTALKYYRQYLEAKNVHDIF